ncbi:MAG: hypothetical protein IJ471_00165 [Eubacterium sp.]|nr:hypothetical protein [Eubacterium sp.]
MLDKKQEYIAEALDEIRDAYIEEAVTYESIAADKPADALDHAAGTDADKEKKEATAIISMNEGRRKPRKRRIYAVFAPIAACLVLVVSLGVYSQQGGFAMNGGSPAGSAGNEAAGGSTGSGEKGAADDEVMEDLNGGVAPGESSDGMASDITGDPEAQVEQSCSRYLTAEEILEKNTAVFRGTVVGHGTESSTFGAAAEDENGNLVYEGNPNGLYEDPDANVYTIITVKVSSCLRGDMEVGELCEIRIPGIPSYFESSIAGDLMRLETGDEAIFMPYIGEDGSYYYEEGTRFLFLQTEDGVSYATDVYDVPGDGEVTLDDVEAYLKKLLK